MLGKMEKTNIRTVVTQKRCTGCSACKQLCPVQAICMRSDEEGFLIPWVDEDYCIFCGLCVKVCPEETLIARHRTVDGNCYIAQSKLYRETKKSASGGIFYTIARYVVEEKCGVVFGAGFDKSGRVVHQPAEKTAELLPLQNSKYVQSDIGDSYRYVKDLLEKGRYVFFTGTPCQVAGLYGYLQRDHENLLTADIICHGVPSPELLNRQIEESSHTWQGKVKSVQFRHKTPLFRSTSSFYMMMKMTYGFPIVRRPADDPFFNIFSKGLGFRESCYQCRYANTDRTGDFTLGDCDSHHFYPEFHPEEANSVIMINDERARKIWNEAIADRCDYALLDIDKERECNKQLKAPSSRPEERNIIYKDLAAMQWKDFSVKYACRQSFKRRIRAYIALILPPFFVKLWGKRNG